ANGLGRVGVGPIGGFGGAKSVVLFDRETFLLPSEIHAPNVFFELDEVEFELGKLIGVLGRNVGPAEGTHGGKATLTGNEFALSGDDDGVDEAGPGDAFGKAFDVAKLPPLALIPVDEDGANGN